MLRVAVARIELKVKPPAFKLYLIDDGGNKALVFLQRHTMRAVLDDDQAKTTLLAPDRAGSVSAAVQHLLDPAPGLFADTFFVVEYKGNRGRGYPCLAGNITHCNSHHL
ncbi:hypothetical protein SDC9_157624 [bioreactor metagenome]|uniref:Uncharacterized protein n=1 Tax=bioreactor metagenome TaxID=1076179 RepID=A0A645FAH3_9ZZZZ